MKAKHKQIAIMAGVALVVSSVVVYLANNNDTVSDKLGKQGWF